MVLFVVQQKGISLSIQREVHLSGWISEVTGLEGMLAWVGSVALISFLLVTAGGDATPFPPDFSCLFTAGWISFVGKTVSGLLLKGFNPEASPAQRRKYDLFICKLKQAGQWNTVLNLKIKSADVIFIQAKSGYYLKFIYKLSKAVFVWPNDWKCAKLLLEFCMVRKWDRPETGPSAVLADKILIQRDLEVKYSYHTCSGIISGRVILKHRILTDSWLLYSTLCTELDWFRD